MSTQKQTLANRRNAQLSTGPRTPEGKFISRMNALKTGIDAVAETACGENPAELAALAANYDREFQPMGAVERTLVDLIVHNDWLLRRYRFLNADLTDHSATAPFNNKEGNEYGAGFAATLNAFQRLHRHAIDSERAYFRNLAELEVRQAIRRQREFEAAAEPSVTDGPKTENPETGFVPQLVPMPPATPSSGPRRLAAAPPSVTETDTPKPTTGPVRSARPSAHPSTQPSTDPTIDPTTDPATQPAKLNGAPVPPSAPRTRR